MSASHCEALKEIASIQRVAQELRWTFKWLEIQNGFSLKSFQACHFANSYNSLAQTVREGPSSEWILDESRCEFSNRRFTVWSSHWNFNEVTSFRSLFAGEHLQPCRQCPQCQTLTGTKELLSIKIQPYKENIRQPNFGCVWRTWFVGAVTRSQGGHSKVAQWL